MPNDALVNEKEMLIRVANGDEAAFRQLFDIHYNKLAAFVQRLTKSSDITEELVQDTFVRVWLNRSELVSINNFESWIYVLARNHVFNQLKKIAREQKQLLEWFEQAAAVDFDTMNDDEAEDLFSFIDRLVEKLPPQQKRIYLLKRKNGLKNEEIAQQLNISLKTVKRHFTLALRFIKDNAKQGIEIIIFLLFFF